MKKTNASLLRKILTATFVIALTLTLLVSCGTKMDTKDTILSRVDASVESGGRGHEFVVDYLFDWGIKNINTYKLSWAERLYQSQYVYDGGLEDTLTHASKTAKLFLDEFYDNIDLSDKNAVTDALLYCYTCTVSDPYSIYRVQEASDEYSENLSGSFVGIGISVTLDREANTVLVVDVFDDSPAEAVGILPGDYIYAVDGKTVDELGIDSVTDNIKGTQGTSVNITIKRGEEFLSFNPLRDSIKEYTVKHEIIEGNIGYVRISSFKSITYDQFVESVDALEAAGVQGIIFDLRYNPGGYVRAAYNMLSYMIPSGHPVLSYQYKDNELQTSTSADDIHPTKKDENGDALISDHKISVPIVVICDANTASSAEIFTAAVRDYRDMGLIKATIVGTTTYKKGVIQNTFTYYDGSTVTFTTAYHLPPSGESYHGVGVTPDVIVELGQTEDTQYNAAITELQKLINENNNLQ